MSHIRHKAKKRNCYKSPNYNAINKKGDGGFLVHDKELVMALREALHVKQVGKKHEPWC